MRRPSTQALALAAAVFMQALAAAQSALRCNAARELVQFHLFGPILFSWLPFGITATLAARRLFLPAPAAFRFTALVCAGISAALSLAEFFFTLYPSPLSAFFLGVSLASALAASPLPPESSSFAPSRSAFTYSITFLAFVASLDLVLQTASRHFIAPIDDSFNYTLAWLELCFVEMFLAFSLLGLGPRRVVLGAALLLLPHGFRAVAPHFWQFWKWMFAAAAVLPLLPRPLNLRRRPTSRCSGRFALGRFAPSGARR